MPTEDCTPNPEYLIKSIAEQGYTLETSIADLIDNSISAGADKVEVLVDTQNAPFQLFITDNGRGMSPAELKTKMNFPSSSMEDDRDPGDLGRFGLGLKTASFSQTRCFTVISKKEHDKKYSARTWDVNHLRDTGKWEIIVNSDEEINSYLRAYRNLTQGFLNCFEGYQPNTIVVWRGLFKFENDVSVLNKSANLQKELTETTKEYLQLIFHRFMERKQPLIIRLNNDHLKPYNPFPGSTRNISVQQKLLMGNRLRLEGYVLPNRSIAESKETSEWTLPHKSLMDMEGMYIYRADRIIVYGGWNGSIKKSPRLQLARLKVEIGNGIDHLFHLNVAKSSVTIPFGERIAFMRYVSELKTEAEKEFFNYETRLNNTKNKTQSIFRKIPSNNGMLLEIDKSFPILVSLVDSLNDEQKKQLSIIFRMITTVANKIKKVHTEESYNTIVEKDGINEEDINNAIALLLNSGVSKSDILTDFIPTMGINNQSLPNLTSKLLQ